MVNIQNIASIVDFEPRRVRKYLYLYCAEGEFTIVVDHKQLTVRQNQVLTITSGQ